MIATLEGATARDSARQRLERRTLTVIRLDARSSALADHEGAAMLAFDPRELRNADVEIGSLPDERGHLIDTKALPARFAEYLAHCGLDMSKPIRVVGVISRRPDGGPGLYEIHFQQD